ADALNLVRSRTKRLMIPGLAEDRRVQGLDGDHLKRRFPALENLTATGNRPARAHSRDQNVDLASGVAPDLLGRGLAVNLWVGRVLELLGHEGVGRILDQLLGLP